MGGRRELGVKWTSQIQLLHYHFHLLARVSIVTHHHRYRCRKSVTLTVVRTTQQRWHRWLQRGWGGSLLSIPRWVSAPSPRFLAHRKLLWLGGCHLIKPHRWLQHEQRALPSLSPGRPHEVEPGNTPRRPLSQAGPGSGRARGRLRRPLSCWSGHALGGEGLVVTAAVKGQEPGEAGLGLGTDSAARVTQGPWVSPLRSQSQLPPLEKGDDTFYCLKLQGS